MPRIPINVAERGINAGSTGPRADAFDFGAGPGLSNLAGGMMNAADTALRIGQQNKRAEELQKEKDGRRWQMEAENQFKLEEVEWLSDPKNRDAENLPGLYRDWHGKRLQEYVKNAPSPDAAEEFRLRRGSHFAQKQAWAYEHSGQIKVAKMAETVTQGITADASALETKARLGLPPQMIDGEYLQSAKEMMDHVTLQFGDLAPSVAGKIKTQAAQDYAIGALNNNRPWLARAVVNEYVKDESVKATLLNRIKSQEDEIDRNADRAMLSFYHEQMKRALDGKPYVAPNADQFRTPEAKAKADEMFRPIAEAAEISRQTAGEVAAKRWEAADRAYTEGKISSDAANLIRKAVEQQAQAEKADFVGSRISYSDTRREQFAKWQKAATEADQFSRDEAMQDLVPEAKAASDAAFEEFASGIIEDQSGTPEAQWRLLPQSWVDNAAATLKGKQTPSEMVGAVRSAMAGIPDKYQGYALADLMRKADGSPALNMWVLDNMNNKAGDPNLPAEVVGHLAAYKQNWDNFKPSFKEQDLQQAVLKNDSFLAFRALNGDFSENSQLVTDIRMATQAQALGKYSSLPAKEAVSKAADEIIGSRYSAIRVNGFPALLRKEDVGNAEELAANVKLALSLVPKDQIADWQVNAFEGQKAKMTQEEIDRHYSERILAVTDSGIGAANPLRSAYALLLEREWEAAKKAGSRQYMLQAALFENGFVRPTQDGKAFTLHISTPSGPTQVVNKKGEPIYMEIADVPKFTPNVRTIYGSMGGLGPVTQVSVAEPQSPEQIQATPSPWKSGKR